MASLMVRFIRSTWPLVHGCLALVVRCSMSFRRQGLEPIGLFAADRPALHPTRQSLHGRLGAGGHYITGTPYVGMNVRMKAGPGGYRGVFSAWDIREGREVWSIKENFPLWSGALATAGGLVF